MSIQCNICANRCKIKENNLGTCKQYKNIEDELVSLNYGTVSSLSPDPIEKKPLYHFMPNTKTFSLGGIGCNMSCLYCQNYMISQGSADFIDTIKITPEAVVENALYYDCRSISFTYNEPNIHLPFYEKIAELGRSKNLKIIFVSNGYFSHESLTEVLKFSDAFNIDLKSMSEKFYKEICKARLGVVLDNLKKIYSSGKHLEVTNLLIHDLNDSPEEIDKLTKFIAEDLGSEVPLHFSRSFPYYKMTDIVPTPEDTLINACKIAKSNGIEYVYTGNAPLSQDSYCPSCGTLLVERTGFASRISDNFDNNKCKNCGCKLNFNGVNLI